MILVPIRDNQFSKQLAIAGIGSRQISIKKSPGFLGEIKHWSGLYTVHIGTSRTILRPI